MPGKPAERRILLNLIGIIILVGGLAGALLIYRCAENKPAEGWGYEEEGGSLYPVRPGDSKKYLRDLELYGGKANVLITEFRLWLVGLFRGKTLAWTVALIALLLAFGFFYAASHPPSPSAPRARKGNDPEGSA